MFLWQGKRPGACPRHQGTISMPRGAFKWPSLIFKWHSLGIEVAFKGLSRVFKGLQWIFKDASKVLQGVFKCHSSGLKWAYKTPSSVLQRADKGFKEQFMGPSCGFWATFKGLSSFFKLSSRWFLGAFKCLEVAFNFLTMGHKVVFKGSYSCLQGCYKRCSRDLQGQLLYFAYNSRGNCGSILIIRDVDLVSPVAELDFCGDNMKSFWKIKDTV